MISDPYCIVTCDGKDCHESIEVHDGTDSAIEQELKRREWLVQDEQHFCSKECLKRRNK